MELIDTIGNTPLLDLTRFIEPFFHTTVDSNKGVLSKAQDNAPPKTVSIHPVTSIFAKCEYFNPTGSIKDRIVAYMLNKAEKRGDLKGVHTLIESTSGNTGAALAMIAAIKGYRALLVIPDRVSAEKQAMLRALGAEVKVMPSHAPVNTQKHYVQVAQQLAKTLPNSFYLNQYHSLDNAQAHYETTGPEIWKQTHGNIDVFIAVAGSGGTLSGIGRYLKKQNPMIKVIAVDPIGSIYHDYFQYNKLPNSQTMASSQIEGAGSDCLTRAMDFSVIDEVMQFYDQDALYTARWLAKKTGLLVGGSSGANLWASLQLAKTAKRALRIVTLLPDSGMKYLSKIYKPNTSNACLFQDKR